MFALIANESELLLVGSMKEVQAKYLEEQASSNYDTIAVFAYKKSNTCGKKKNTKKKVKSADLNGDGVVDEKEYAEEKKAKDK